MISPKQMQRVQKLCMTGLDRYGGLTAEEYVLKGWNVRSRRLPYCPCCGVSTSIEQTVHDRWFHLKDAIHPEYIRLTSWFTCGACGAKVEYDRFERK